jgi:hypothetical protein
MPIIRSRNSSWVLAFSRDTVVPEYERILADTSALHGLEQAETNPRDPAWTSTVGIVQIAIAAAAGSATAPEFTRGDAPARSTGALTV